MASINAPITSFAGGRIGSLLHGRVDVAAYARAGEIYQNFRPMAQGGLTRRPPMEYIDSFTDHDRQGTLLPFVFNTEQSYLILATTDGFDFFIQDGRIATDSVSATISEGTFATSHSDLADSASITASSTGSGGVSNLVDENTTTSWASLGTGDAYLDFDLSSATTLYDIWLTSDDTDANDAPNTFTLSGSATGAFAGEETTVLTVTADSNWATQERRKYRITTPGSYRYYRLNMTDSEAGVGTYRLSEVSLFDGPWLDNSTGAATITVTGGRLYLDSDGANTSIAEQLVSISETSSNHVLKFEIVHGPISLRIGSTSGEDDILGSDGGYEDLKTGIHHISFDPDGNSSVYIQFYHTANAGRILDNVSIASGTTFRLDCPYAESDLIQLKWKQIGDVLYLAHPDYEPRRLERRGHRSWSITFNRPDDGPFEPLNTTLTTVAGDDTTGEVTLTSNNDLFTSADQGKLMAITDAGQLKSTAASANGVYTDGIKVTGGDASARTFNIQVAASTFDGVVTLESSSGDENNYTSTGKTYTGNANENYYDAKDNQTWYYRLGTTTYVSGTVTMTLNYSGGTSTGIVRIIEVTSATTATTEVLEPLASTDSVKTWQKSSWGSDVGFPVAVTGGFGRLIYGRGTTLWLSVSDDLTSFEEGDEDDKAFSWTLAQASSKGMRWLAFLNRLCIGAQTAEQVGFGNTGAEPVSPTNFQTIDGSEEGVADLQPVTSEGAVLYVHRSTKKLMQFTQNPKAISDDNYISIDLTELDPQILEAGVKRIAIQREPQRRIYAVLNNGKVGELLFRREIEVTAWHEIKTTGRVEDVQVIQQEDEDVVYFIVRRLINGSWKRFIERFGTELVLEDWKNYYLDSALSLDLTYPATTIEASGTTGTITVTADDSVFVSGDTGKIMWLAGGRGAVTYVSGTEVTVALTSDLDEDFGTDPQPANTWGLGSATSAVSGLDHLEGETVTLYADRQNYGEFTVSSGTITKGSEQSTFSVAQVGLSMRSRWKSLKLSYGAQRGTALTMKKAIKTLGLILHRTGETLKYGHSWSKMFFVNTRDSSVNWGEPVPLFTGEKEVNFASQIRRDSRLYAEVEGPEPATILAAIPSIETNEK